MSSLDLEEMCAAGFLRRLLTTCSVASNRADWRRFLLLDESGLVFGELFDTASRITLGKLFAI